MINCLITSRTRRKILGFLILNPDELFYMHEIAKETLESPQALNNELTALMKAGYIFAIGEGRQKRYQINKKQFFYEELKKIFEKSRNNNDPEFQFTDIARKKLIEETLDIVVPKIIANYDPQKIILFGSVAKGKIRENSDIDLLIIHETNLPYMDRIRAITTMCDYNMGIDFFVYTSKEYADMIKSILFVKKEISENGKILYEKAA